MNGLERILLKIEEDNNEKVKQIIDAAERDGREEADKILSEAEKQAEKIIKDAEKKAEVIIESAKNGARAAEARYLTSSKAEIINQGIKKAAERLKDLADEEYFKLIFKLILKYAHPCSGELILSLKDKYRLPNDFLEDINNELSKKGGSLVLSDEDIEADGGFVLRYGGIDENCSFDALIRERENEIKDALLKEIKEV